MASVKTQCQNAADSAALAGARTLTGSTSTSQAQANALTAASANSAIGWNASNQMTMVGFKSGEVSTTCGTYHYSTTNQSFSPAYTLQTGENYNLVSATVQRQMKNTFFAVDGGTNNAATAPTITANAVAAHRPRDVAIMFSLDGSINDESDLWNAHAWNPYTSSSNNADSIVPTFGHYENSSAGLVATTSYPYASSNITQPFQGIPAQVNSFYSTPSTATSSVPAFTAAPSSYGTYPMGDMPATDGVIWGTSFGQANFSQNVNTLLFANFTTSYNPYYDFNFYQWFELGGTVSGRFIQGYDYLYYVYNSNGSIPPSPSAHGGPSGAYGFSGFTQGPGYWGKTFFIWPPDPRSTQDWRQLYFTDASNLPVVNNTTLWTSSGVWITPYTSQTNYHINYKAILNWISNIGANPFPSSLYAGKIAYYTAIPTDVPASAYDHSQSNGNISNANQRFWKEYIDYVLGVWRDPYGNVWTPGSQGCNYGPDYTWGSVQITAKPTGIPPSGYNLCYMNYNDNPMRPRHRMWFGPMTMIQFLADTGRSPGTLRDVSSYSLKLGLANVLQNMAANHLNDEVSLIPYSYPQFTGDSTMIGRFNQALSNLSNNPSAMISSLWYPPNSSSANVSPFDSNGTQTPSAFGDYVTSNDTEQGLLLAYNQFSTSSTVSAAGVGGLGRVGARKLVIVEMDSETNATSSIGFTYGGSYNSYYNILPGNSISFGGNNTIGMLFAIQYLCNTASGSEGTPNSVGYNSGYPGFATASKPVVVHALGYGIEFQVSNSLQSTVVQSLQQISQVGGTTFPSSASDPTNGYKWIIGTPTARAAALEQAIYKILNDDQAISIVE